MRALVIAVLTVLLLTPAWSQPERPKLVVLVVIDQFRNDYLQRFEDLFSSQKPGGFRYFTREGAVHTRCFYDHVPTHTAVGHAALSTGALPSVHGIIGNKWLNFQTKKLEEVAYDGDYPLVGTDSRYGVSPRKLLASTFGDEMKLQSVDRSKVIGIALKDRAAMMATGRGADLALFFDSRSGRWLTSTYYRPDGTLPGWVETYNASGWADELFGTVWKPLFEEKVYQRCRRQQFPGSADYNGLGKTYPHQLDGGLESPGPNFYEAIKATPQGVVSTFEMARRAVEYEKLGQDEHPDLLAVSLSSNDLVGHTFGPYSPEMLDVTVTSDREMEKFFQFLDEKVGLKNTLIVLSADHGVAPLPELIQERTMPGGRLSFPSLQKVMGQVLASELGVGQFVLGANEPNLYLDREAIPADKLEAVTEKLAQALRQVEGVHAVFTRDQILEGELPRTELASTASNSYHHERSGDLWLFTEPFWIISFPKYAAGTTHGSSWSYDTHVPLLVVGPGVPQGRFRKQCTPRDVAPTICELLGLTPPSGSSGHLLEWLEE